MDFINLLSSVDSRLTLFLNGLHLPFLDFLMDWVSYRFTWVPFYTFLLFVMYKKFGRDILLIVLVTAVMVTVSDQTANYFKNHVQRLRPCHDPSISAMIHLVTKCGGKFGFFSGHASNTFSLSVFLVLINRKRISRLPLIMFSFAILVSYSRVYNGVHFAGDILCGALCGSALAWLFSRIYLFSEMKIHKIH
jgi:undecaprenyl-diphosphatase